MYSGQPASNPAPVAAPPVATPTQVQQAQTASSEVNANILEHRFLDWLTELKKLDDCIAAVRILKGSSIEISFLNSEIIIDTKGNNTIGGILEDARSMMESHASSYFGSPMQVMVKGSKVRDTTQLFAGFETATQPTSPPPPPAQPVEFHPRKENPTPSTISATHQPIEPSKSNAPITSEPRTAVQDTSEIAHSTDADHPLDRLIIDLFKAEEQPIPRR